MSGAFKFDTRTMTLADLPPGVSFSYHTSNGVEVFSSYGDFLKKHGTQEQAKRWEEDRILKTGTKAERQKVLDSRVMEFGTAAEKRALKTKRKADREREAERRNERKAYMAEYRKKNADRLLEYAAGAKARRRSAKMCRTPGWSSAALTDAVYRYARTTGGCQGDIHVDHIIPLQGDSVSGLHVAENLRLVSKAENLSKGNRFRQGDELIVPTVHTAAFVRHLRLDKMCKERIRDLYGYQPGSAWAELLERLMQETC